MEPANLVREVPLRALAEVDVALWQELSNASAEPNPYLRPEFVLSALRYLDPDRQVVAVFVHDGPSADAPLGAMLVLDTSAAKSRFGLRLGSAYASRHSFLGGILLVEGSAKPATTLLRWLKDSGRFDALLIRDVFGAGPSLKLLEAAVRKAGLKLVIYGKYLRPVIPSPGSDTKHLAERGLGKGRLRDYQRRRRKLEAIGALGWRIVPAGSAEFPKASENFLRLEDQGWKKSAKSSLRSEQGGEDFFRELLIEKMKVPNSCFFSELMIGIDVIASAFQFKDRDMIFAFKVGMDVRFASYSPGILNELFFLDQINVALPGISYIDSGSYEDSFIGKLWPDRTEIMHVAVSFSMRASAYFFATHLARTIYRKFRR